MIFTPRQKYRPTIMFTIKLNLLYRYNIYWYMLVLQHVQSDTVYRRPKTLWSTMIYYMLIIFKTIMYNLSLGYIMELFLKDNKLIFTS